MIELTNWIDSKPYQNKPWLLLGKGPTFSRRHHFDLAKYNTIGLNHVVREQHLNIAHMIDIDVVGTCGQKLADNCDFLLMPRHPHVNFRASDKRLEDFFTEYPVLKQLDNQNRLVWYSLHSRPVTGSPTISTQTISSVAALRILVKLGATVIRSLGLDGGKQYAAEFADLDKTTRLACGWPTFDVQFKEFHEVVKKWDLDYDALSVGIRVYIGTEESQYIAARVLQWTINKHGKSSGVDRQVDFMSGVSESLPVPRDKHNRQRTPFSFNRFAIPGLAGYRGRALYLDADMIVFDDIAKLWDIEFGKHKILCTTQTKTPPGFQKGRQTSVMLLDCNRLNWDATQIIKGLNDGHYTYEQLMHRMCIIKPDEIADSIPPEWNCLEHYESTTKLLHYTNMPVQPWRNNANSLRQLWIKEFNEAVRAKFITPAEVLTAIHKKHIHPSLASACL